MTLMWNRPAVLPWKATCNCDLSVYVAIIRDMFVQGKYFHLEKQQVSAQKSGSLLLWTLARGSSIAGSVTVSEWYHAKSTTD